MGKSVAEFFVEALKAEGVEYVFGLPGEENIRFVDALRGSGIRFILTRHEQGAAFMADIYGRVTGKAGVCMATLGPGAINLLQGVADAQTNSSPLVAMSAQVGLNRIYKESHQVIDLQSMFRPATKWSETVLTPASVPEMVRKAFALAQDERPGATYLAVPQDIEELDLPENLKPLRAGNIGQGRPDPAYIEEAVAALKKAKHPIILAGHGVARTGASQALVALAESLNIPVATTFMGKGVIDDRHPLALGVIGFMRRDYENFAFDESDLILSIGYELQEFAPSRINPDGDKTIIHMHTIPVETDSCYTIEVGVIGDIALGMDALREAAAGLSFLAQPVPKIRALLEEERQAGSQDTAMPIKPQRVVMGIREVMGDDDIVLADTGAVKMWMARLYPTYKPLTCLMSNGLSTMAFSLPGAIGAHLAYPDRRVLAVMGDGSYLMNDQEIETAVREKIPLKILIWVDDSYGLIKWKMDMELGRHSGVDFQNPDFVAHAESYGAKGYLIKSEDEFVPTLKKALEEDGVSVIACPVDYRENTRLTDRLGQLTMTF
ncbi:acetolactate synthase large subunit [Saccharibacter sp. 17.LH.SD]|uniref:acetolactate synthase large subunit n=1 Tax=Saccharibacter sp. 17.LH.SD TaxID=2689393 RepID=UPI00136F734D|nr:acetolactate synthase large subunit [Saccharibacter sp. 17.LH.SD]MXV44965.1 acetolactate synthase large subunit [Saccharibacter sp. 17.LH.SD]